MSSAPSTKKLLDWLDADDEEEATWAPTPPKPSTTASAPPTVGNAPCAAAASSAGSCTKGSSPNKETSPRAEPLHCDPTVNASSCTETTTQVNQGKKKDDTALANAQGKKEKEERLPVEKYEDEQRPEPFPLAPLLMLLTNDETNGRLLVELEASETFGVLLAVAHALAARRWRTAVDSAPEYSPKLPKTEAQEKAEKDAIVEENNRKLLTNDLIKDLYDSNFRLSEELQQAISILGMVQARFGIDLFGGAADESGQKGKRRELPGPHAGGGNKKSRGK